MNDPYNGIKNAINQYNEHVDYLKKQIEQLQKENAELKEKQKEKVFVKNKNL